MLMTSPPGWSPLSSDARAESSGAPDGGRLAEMPRRMEQRDAGEQHGARAPRERLDDHLASGGRERALGRRTLEAGRLAHALPVLRLEAADHVARAPADRVAIFAERADVELPGQIPHFGARHADPEVAPRDAEPLHPRVVEYLVAAGEGGVHDDVLGARDMPHEPRDRVEVLARPHPHLVVGEAAERPLDERHLVATHRRRLHGRMLLEKEITRIHQGILL